MEIKRTIAILGPVHLSLTFSRLSSLEGGHISSPTEDLDDEAGEAGKPEEVTDGGQVERDGKGHRDVAKKLGKALKYMSNKYSNTSMKIMDKMVWQEEDEVIIRILAQLLFS